MDKLEDIFITQIDSITLEYVLSNCDNEHWTDGHVAKSRYLSTVGSDINKSIRNVYTCSIDDELVNFLDTNIDPYIQNYAIKNNMSEVKNTQYSLVKYVKGQFFTEHVDATKEFPRKISAILYLNDNYEGGTVTFTKFNKTFKPKENTLFIFPSGESFSHSADPVLSGVKYVIVGFWS